MEAFVLLGGFAAFGVFGYFLMSKLDRWLAALPNNEGPLDQVSQIRLATSQPDSIPGITTVLKHLGGRYPECRCTLLLGQEREIVDALACGWVDMAILSDHTDMSSMRCQDIRIDTRSVSIVDDTIDMRTLGPVPAHQHLLWNDKSATAYLSELIGEFCHSS